MKKKSKSLLSSLLVLGLTAGTNAARADEADVKRLEDELKSYAKDKDPNIRYADQLYHLAGVYRENGMRQKSDETFNKFLQLWRKKPQSESEASLMLGWANQMIAGRNVFSYPNGTSQEVMDKDQARDEIEHKQDLLKAAKITDDALVMASKLSPTSEEKITVLFSAASVYENTSSPQKRQHVISELDRIFRSMEQEKNASPNRVKLVANSLIQLSDMYCPMTSWRQTMMHSPVSLLPDTTPRSHEGTRVSDFKIAEAYRLRAMAQYDRLPACESERINAQRSIVAWYRLYGQTQKYNAQLKKLGTLLGTNDPKKLFPEPAYCPACGMG